jgi:hypothetical protein
MNTKTYTKTSEDVTQILAPQPMLPQSDDIAEVKVCIVIVYFGKWPAWIEYYLKSCRTNKDFHWLIFSDCLPVAQPPLNVKTVALDKNQLESIVSEKLGIKYHLSRGYKLVDLKPAYGHIFAEWLRDYAFWGYADLDVIYGDISYWITPAVLDNYDIVTASDRLLVGHFTILRNCERMVMLYTQCTDYLKILCSEIAEGFDEKGFNVLAQRLASQNALRLLQWNIKEEDIILRLNRRRDFVILWRDGQLWDAIILRRLSYFHFMESKWSQDFSVSPRLAVCNTFYIHPTGIYAVRNIFDGMLLILRLSRAFALTTPWYFMSLVKAILPQTLRGRIKAWLGKGPSH